MCTVYCTYLYSILYTVQYLFVAYKLYVQYLPDSEKTEVDINLQYVL